MSETSGQIETGEGVIGWQVTGPDGEIVAAGPPAVPEASAGEES